MSFADVQCPQELKATLAGMIDSGRIPHALMFHEDDGGGAFPLCAAFLQYLYCRSRQNGDSCGQCPACHKIGRLIHPDVHYIVPMTAGHLTIDNMAAIRTLAQANPCFRESELNAALNIEGKNSVISVGESRALIGTLALSALEGGYRSVVVYLPEKMNAEAANTILKLLEEPPALTQFLMITHAPERVLPTIASRCQRLRVPPADALAAGSAAETALYSPLFLDLMEGVVTRNLLACLDAGEQIAALPSRENVKAFCNFAAENIRSVFLLQQGVALPLPQGAEREKLAAWAAGVPKTFPSRALEVLDRTRSLVDRNVNLKLALTDMMDRLWNLL